MRFLCKKKRKKKHFSLVYSLCHGSHVRRYLKHFSQSAILSTVKKDIFQRDIERATEYERVREEEKITRSVFQISPSRNTLQSISVATVFSRVSWRCRANGVCLKWYNFVAVKRYNSVPSEHLVISFCANCRVFAYDITHGTFGRPLALPSTNCADLTNRCDMCIKNKSYKKRIIYFAKVSLVWK